MQFLIKNIIGVQHRNPLKLTYKRCSLYFYVFSLHRNFLMCIVEQKFVSVGQLSRKHKFKKKRKIATIFRKLKF